jgi:hypothetical protein
MNDNDQNDEHLPDAIVERLRARDRNVTFLTPRVDAAIERAAAEQFARRGAKGFRHARWALPAAAAAALLAAIVVIKLGGDVEPAAPLVADDVDGSGQVDILDAFALARAHAGAGEASPAEQPDVARLAARVVALTPRADARSAERVL